MGHGHSQTSNLQSLTTHPLVAVDTNFNLLTRWSGCHGRGETEQQKVESDTSGLEVRRSNDYTALSGLRSVRLYAVTAQSREVEPNWKFPTATAPNSWKEQYNIQVVHRRNLESLFATSQCERRPLTSNLQQTISETLSIPGGHTGASVDTTGPAAHKT